VSTCGSTAGMRDNGLSAHLLRRYVLVYRGIYMHNAEHLELYRQYSSRWWCLQFQFVAFVVLSGNLKLMSAIVCWALFPHMKVMLLVGSCWQGYTWTHYECYW
jgi:hypothetical protein